MKNYCISAKCTEVKNTRGDRTWKSRAEKKVAKDVKFCPDCGTPLVQVNRRKVIPDLRFAI